MFFRWSTHSDLRSAPAAGAVALLVGVPLAVLLALGGGPSVATATAVDLGTAGAFGVLGGQTVTNTGPSVISRDLGTSPGSAVTGFPPGTVLGTIHTADSVAGQAQSDLTTAYGVVAGQASDESISADLAGRTLTTGVYTASSTMGLSGQLTLDAQGDPSALFIFQVGSALTTASGSAITLTNGAQACNVYWQVGSSATLGTASIFRGTILALASISATTGATVEGRLLASTGSVTLDDNTIFAPGCSTGATGTGSTGTGSTGTSGTGTSGTGTSGTGTPSTGSAGSGSGGNGTTSAGSSGTGGTGSDNSAASNGGLSTTATTGATGPGRITGTDQSVTDIPTRQQIGRVPEGFPATGDGGSLSHLHPAAIATGFLALVVAAGILFSGRRRTSRA